MDNPTLGLKLRMEEDTKRHFCVASTPAIPSSRLPRWKKEL